VEILSVHVYFPFLWGPFYKCNSTNNLQWMKLLVLWDRFQYKEKNRCIVLFWYFSDVSSTLLPSSWVPRNTLPISNRKLFWKTLRPRSVCPSPVGIVAESTRTPVHLDWFLSSKSHSVTPNVDSSPDQTLSIPAILLGNGKSSYYSQNNSRTERKGLGWPLQTAASWFPAGVSSQRTEHSLKLSGYRVYREFVFAKLVWPWGLDTLSS
jgi:hypothetical protein